MINEKKCRSCKQTKPLDQFGTSAAGKHGVKAHCKPCMVAIEMDRWHRKNPTSTTGQILATQDRDRFNALLLKSFPPAHTL